MGRHDARHRRQPDGLFPPGLELNGIADLGERASGVWRAFFAQLRARWLEDIQLALSRAGISGRTITAGNIGGALGAGVTLTGGAAIGTVTSVALTAPATFSVSGSPVTSSGTLAVAWATQSANTVLAGPSSGAATTPTFRSLVPADYPVFVASGTSHAAGAVPDPGAVAGTTRFLREDGTWSAPAGSGATLASDTDVTITSPADGDRLTYQASSSKWINDPEYVYVTIPLGDGVNAITTGTKQPDAIGLPAGSLAEARLVTSGASGNVTVDVLRATYTAFPTFTSLVGGLGTKPNIANAATAQKYSDTSFTSWTSTTFADGDMVQANVASAATLTTAQLILKIKRAS